MANYKAFERDMQKFLKQCEDVGAHMYRSGDHGMVVKLPDSESTIYVPKNAQRGTLKSLRVAFAKWEGLDTPIEPVKEDVDMKDLSKVLLDAAEVAAELQEKVEKGNDALATQIGPLKAEVKQLREERDQAVADLATYKAEMQDKLAALRQLGSLFKDLDEEDK